MKQADFLAPRIECEFSDCRRYRYTQRNPNENMLR